MLLHPSKVGLVQLGSVFEPPTTSKSNGFRSTGQVPIAPDLAAARLSFSAACDCIDLVLLAKRRVASPSAVEPQLQSALAKHLELHKLAHGVRAVKPKHHWQLDMPRQLSRDGLVLDAFIVERIHLQVKAIGDKVPEVAPMTVLMPILGSKGFTCCAVKQQLRCVTSRWSPGSPGQHFFVGATLRCRTRRRLSRQCLRAC